MNEASLKPSDPLAGTQWAFLAAPLVPPAITAFEVATGATGFAGLFQGLAEQLQPSVPLSAGRTRGSVRPTSEANHDRLADRRYVLHRAQFESVLKKRGTYSEPVFENNVISILEQTVSYNRLLSVRSTSEIKIITAEAMMRLVQKFHDGDPQSIAWLHQAIEARLPHEAPLQAEADLTGGRGTSGASRADPFELLKKWSDTSEVDDGPAIPDDQDSGADRPATATESRAASSPRSGAMPIWRKYTDDGTLIVPDGVLLLDLDDKKQRMPSSAAYDQALGAPDDSSAHHRQSESRPNTGSQ